MALRDRHADRQAGWEGQKKRNRKKDKWREKEKESGGEKEREVYNDNEIMMARVRQGYFAMQKTICICCCMFYSSASSPVVMFSLLFINFCFLHPLFFFVFVSNVRVRNEWRQQQKKEKKSCAFFEMKRKKMKRNVIIYTSALYLERVEDPKNFMKHLSIFIPF